MKPRESMTFGALFYDSFPSFKVIYSLFGKDFIPIEVRIFSHKGEMVEKMFAGMAAIKKGNFIYYEVPLFYFESKGPALSR